MPKNWRVKFIILDLLAKDWAGYLDNIEMLVASQLGKT
jgi:hypothetical protein